MDARSVVVEANARFDAAMTKSDPQDDAGISKSAGISKDNAKMEETRLNGARAKLVQATSDMSAISVGATRFGAARQPGRSKPKQQDGGEGISNLRKRKLHAPKNGWKDPKGVTMHFFTGRFCLYQHASNIFWKLRE
jgi:hypothetical protein